MVARADLPDDVAALIARVIVENRTDFEVNCQHLPVAHSPLHYPIRPEAVGDTAPVPLHAGAARYYREQRWLP